MIEIMERVSDPRGPVDPVDPMGWEGLDVWDDWCQPDAEPGVEWEPALDPRYRIGPAMIEDWHAWLAHTELPTSEAGYINLITALEGLKACAAAIQARASVGFATARHQAEADRGVPVSRRGRGIGTEIGLARRESPHRGAHLLGLATALVTELPCTLARLTDGTLNEWRATLITRETACLDPADRVTVDAWLDEHERNHPGLGDNALVTTLRRKVIEIDQTAYLRRMTRAAGQRRVTMRPLADGMVQLTAILPLAPGIGCYAALTRAADRIQAAGGMNGRSRSAVLADLLIEWLTTGSGGGGPAGRVPVAVQVVITDKALLGASAEPAHVDGYGPVPAGWVRDLLTTHPDQAATIRRLFRAPGRLITMEATSQTFPPGLRNLIRLRDQRCRSPWCGAPIRHTDHITGKAHNGPASWLNGQGLCETCNYTKTAPGWTATSEHTPHGHTVTITTPTGHIHHTTHPDGPGAETDEGRSRLAVSESRLAVVPG